MKGDGGAVETAGRLRGLRDWGGGADGDGQIEVEQTGNWRQFASIGSDEAMEPCLGWMGWVAGASRNGTRRTMFVRRGERTDQ